MSDTWTIASSPVAGLIFFTIFFAVFGIIAWMMYTGRTRD
jgi:hypothetical protein